MYQKHEAAMIALRTTAEIKCRLGRGVDPISNMVLLLVAEVACARKACIRVGSCTCKDNPLLSPWVRPYLRIP